MSLWEALLGAKVQYPSLPYEQILSLEIKASTFPQARVDQVPQHRPRICGYLLANYIYEVTFTEDISIFPLPLLHAWHIGNGKLEQQQLSDENDPKSKRKRHVKVNIVKGLMFGATVKMLFRMPTSNTIACTGVTALIKIPLSIQFTPGVKASDDDSNGGVPVVSWGHWIAFLVLSCRVAQP